MQQTAIPQQFDAVFADAHVHLHDCFDIADVLDSALSSFWSFASRYNYGNSPVGVLFLTEMRGENRFAKLHEKALDVPAARMRDRGQKWQFYRTDEAVSLMAVGPYSQPLILLAGRQIVTQEGLEVLALVTDTHFEDGLPISETLQSVINRGGLPVLPWGFGKWMGKRGKILQEILQSEQFSPLFLGDNGGRPSFWPTPPYFKGALDHNIPTLPGTDPLPLPSEYQRVGSYGFKISGTISSTQPGHDIRQRLLDSSQKIEAFGYLENPVKFMWNQLAIRAQKFANRKCAATPIFLEPNQEEQSCSHAI
ncbi:MAG: hypothetical protein ACFBSF_20835 [Leptolyngbyaceae cyanobacterium]